MQKKVSDHQIKVFEAELEKLVRNAFESIMLEERAMYLETHPAGFNGYYTHDLRTLVGPVEDLKVPRVREGDFHPQILPYRRQVSLELFEAILVCSRCGKRGGTDRPLSVLKGCLGVCVACLFFLLQGQDTPARWCALS